MVRPSGGTLPKRNEGITVASKIGIRIQYRLYRRSQLRAARQRRRINASTAIILGLLIFAVAATLLLAIPSRIYPDVTESALDHANITGPPRFQVVNDRLKLQNELRTTLLQALAGVALLIGAYGTWRQVQVTRESQVTDRFIRVVDQLGRPDQAVDAVIGAIYGLERLARDSARDRRSICEILTAHVRARAGTEGGPKQEETHPRRVLQVRAPTIQAAVSVLGRGDFSDLKLLIDQDIRVLDLNEVDLSVGDMSECVMQGAYMWGARLWGCNLLNADLRWTDLDASDLREVVANNANFRPHGFIMPT